MPVESAMHELGRPAAPFALLDTTTGTVRSLEQLRGDVATVVMFLCNHCPFVVHVNDQLVALATDLAGTGVAFVAISSNDPTTHPIDGPEHMTAYAERLGYPFPYLFDETQEVAKAYGAVCTPDFFVYDAGLALAYRGRLDGSTPGNGAPNDGADLRAALADLRAGRAVAGEQVPSMGCSIKWRQ